MLRTGVATGQSDGGSDQTHHSGSIPGKAKALIDALHDYVLLWEALVVGQEEEQEEGWEPVKMTDLG